MADTALTGAHPPATRAGRSGRLTRLIATPAFQKWAARFPLTRRLVRREGEAMFDLVAGFCHSQILQAFVKFDIPRMLLAQEMTRAALAHSCGVPADRMHVLLQGATSLGLIKAKRQGRIALTARGAALAGVPGLQGMIAHHDVLYRDLADPVAFFRGETETELAAFWPYVFGAAGATDPAVTATYSELMSDSQALVAADTLATVSLSGVQRIVDIGGGTGAFLAAVAADHPDIALTLFDLPAVAPAARERFDSLGWGERLTIVPGSFRDDPLPSGADMISLIRVMYDHADETVLALLRSVHAALPTGGRILISEPMSGGARPERAGDAYFALYCMAMRTGRARSAQEISKLLTKAGFGQIVAHKPRRAFVTSVVSGVRLD